MRSPGTIESILEGVPPGLVDVAEVVTHAGDYNTVLLVSIVAGIVAAFLSSDWRRFPVMVGVVVMGIVVVSGLKTGFALPRPPAAGMGGFGFPSGHAFMTTVTYGLIAREADVGSTRTRYALTALIVLAVSASRVLIGVHYPIDVIVGATFGATYLAFVFWIGRRDYQL